jgi:alginate O-acetyltransferase complex protein AlgI
VNARAAVALFFIGFLKKAVVSDNVSMVVDAYFAAPQQYNLYSSFIGIIFYAIQVYCDFSGYSDMAIATARLLGYELTLNFDFPFFSASISEFWRRWHISLATWLRDYVYIPLGGNRGSKLFIFRNMMITLLLGGLWHGASWNFAFWGLLNGILLTLHRRWEEQTEHWSARFHRFMDFVGVPLNFYVFLITVVFVRARDVWKEGTHEVLYSGTWVSGQVLKAICLFDAPGKRSFTIDCLWVLLGLTIIHYANYRRWLGGWWQRIPYWLFAALIGIGFAVALVFVPARYKPFIYFQF